MNARWVGFGVGFLVMIGLAATGALFWVQNGSRHVIVSLNLGVAQIQTTEAVPLPAVIAVSVGVGVLVGASLVLSLWWRAQVRSRDRREIELSRDGDF
jgi:hypothetical protein